MTVTSISAPNAPAMMSARKNASQKLRFQFQIDQAMNVMNIAISPWAKLTMPVER